MRALLLLALLPLARASGTIGTVAGGLDANPLFGQASAAAGPSRSQAALAEACADRSQRRAQLLARVGAREKALAKASARQRRGKASSKAGLSTADRDVLLPRRAGQRPAAASGSQAACSAVGSVGLLVGNTGRGDGEEDRGGRLDDNGEVCSGIGSAGLLAGTTGGGDGKDGAWGRPFSFSDPGADDDVNHVPDRKGSVVTFNCSEEGQLLRFLDSCEHTVVAIQEHHVAEDRLPDLQHRALDPGWHGVWSSAIKSGNQEGTQAGLAILAKGDVLVTAPPGRSTPHMANGRALAAHVHWGVPGGFILISTYLYVNEGLSDINVRILAEICEYIEVVNAMGLDWIVAGDFNLEQSELGDMEWLYGLGGALARPSVSTCRQSLPGKTIDYFLLTTNLLPRTRRPYVQENGDTFPHLPVVLRIMGKDVVLKSRTLASPKRPSRQPKPGCARYPLNWSQVNRIIDQAVDNSTLGAAWDAVLAQLEIELLARYDIVGSHTEAYRGRGGDTQMQYTKLRWEPPRRRGEQTTRDRAWTAAGRWARHLRRYKESLVNQTVLLCHQERVGTMSNKAFDKLARMLVDITKFMARIRNDPLRDALDEDARNFFDMDIGFVTSASTNDMIESIIDRAEACQKRQNDTALACWRDWAASSFKGGGRFAHRHTRGRALQEVCAACLLPGSEAQPFKMADRAMREWDTIWHMHDLPEPVPHGSDQWDDLPHISLDDIKRAILQFPWTTGIGHFEFAPRSFWFVSDAGLESLARLFMRCEKLLIWPSSRILTQLVRIPKSTGGCRLIALMHTLTRIWGRVRRPTAVAWERDHAHPTVWGTGPGRSSSDSAFSLNLASEIAHELREDCVTVFIDMVKCYECVNLQALLGEARATGFPLRLAWMAIQNYTQPRALRAFGSLSYSVSTSQGILAGCSLATTLLTVLLYRSLNLSVERFPSVEPRDLMDDVSFNWAGKRRQGKDPGDSSHVLAQAVQSFCHDIAPLGLRVQANKSGFVANTCAARDTFARHISQLGFRSKHGMRNLGHEMHGVKVLRVQEKTRLRVLQAKRRKVWGLRQAQPEAVKALWRTGLLPAASHGGGVSGVSDVSLRELRTFAGGMVGAKPKSCLTTYLCTQKDDRFDPVFDASVPLVVRFATCVWEARVVPSRLARAWLAIKDRIQHTAAWKYARGPISSVWSTLLRIGWSMSGPTTLVSDEGWHIDLLRVCPQDVRVFLEQGIRRWQAARVLAHFPDNEGHTVWRRALRKSVLALRDAGRRGALRSLWAAGVWTPERLHSINLRPTPLCFVCKEQVGTEAHQWWGCDSMLECRPEEAMPDNVLEHRASLVQSYQTDNGKEAFFLNYGLPPLPPFPEPVADSLPTMGWGDWRGVWGPKVYTDGSGLANSMEGLTRCGWAVVQLDESGCVVRAIYGPLPGRLQTVPRAEHYAALRAVQVAAHPAEIVSDHLSLVKTGRQLSSLCELGASRQASIWRQIRHDLGQSESPNFRWTSAHRSLDDVLPLGAAEVFDFVGNEWADYFAKLGSQSHAVPQVLVDVHKSRLQVARKDGEAFAWMVQAAARKAEQLQPAADIPKTFKAAPAPALSITSHSLQFCEEIAEWRCSVCNRFSKTALSYRFLRNSECAPTALQRATAERFFRVTPKRYVPETAPSVQVALDAAGAAPEEEEGTLPAGAAADGVVEVCKSYGHPAERFGPAVICLACGAFSIHGGRNAKLTDRPCKGHSSVASTRANEESNISRVLRGLHPRSGAALTPD